MHISNLFSQGVLQWQSVGNDTTYLLTVFDTDVFIYGVSVEYETEQQAVSSGIAFSKCTYSMGESESFFRIVL